MIPNPEEAGPGEILVTKCEFGTKHVKGGRGYAIPVKVTTACGKTAMTSVSADKVRDLPRAKASYQEGVDGKATFITTGGMVCQKWRIG